MALVRAVSDRVPAGRVSPCTLVLLLPASNRGPWHPEPQQGLSRHFLWDSIVGLGLQKLPAFLGVGGWSGWNHSSLGDTEFLRGLAFAGIYIHPHSLSKRLLFVLRGHSPNCCLTISPLLLLNPSLSGPEPLMKAEEMAVGSHVLTCLLPKTASPGPPGSLHWAPSDTCGPLPTQKPGGQLSTPNSSASCSLSVLGAFRTHSHCEINGLFPLPGDKGQQEGRCNSRGWAGCWSLLWHPST